MHNSQSKKWGATLQQTGIQKKMIWRFRRANSAAIEQHSSRRTGRLSYFSTFGSQGSWMEGRGAILEDSFQVPRVQGFWEGRVNLLYQANMNKFEVSFTSPVRITRISQTLSGTIGITILHLSSWFWSSLQVQSSHPHFIVGLSEVPCTWTKNIWLHSRCCLLGSSSRTVALN